MVPWFAWVKLCADRHGDTAASDMDTGSPASGTIEVSDEMLLAGIAGRDEAAFRLLMQRHVPRIVRMAQKMLGSAADADEIAQEVLLRIWLNAGRFDPARARPTTWIYKMVYNLCIDRLRTARATTLDAASSATDPAPDALEAMTRTAELRQLGAALAALPDRQRAALLLFYYEEVSGDDAAAALGLRLGAFWSLLHRARQSVHRALTAPRSGPRETSHGHPSIPSAARYVRR